MKILPVYGTYVDGGERDLGTFAGYFSDRKAAELCVKGRGWYGSDGHIDIKQAIDTGNGVYLLADTKPITLNQMSGAEKEKLRAQALSKLTPQEIQALTT